MADLPVHKIHNLKRIHVILWSGSCNVNCTVLAQAGPVVDAGGIFEYARRTGMMKAAA